MKKKTATKKPKMVVVDFNTLSQWGLVAEINRQVLHPRGLALCYDPDTGRSAGANIDEQDFRWEFEPEFDKELKERLAAFDANHIGCLKEEISRQRGKAATK